MKQFIALLALATSLFAFGDKASEFDTFPALTAHSDSAWIVMIRQKDRRTNEWKMDIYANQQEVGSLEDNEMLFFKVPAGEQPLMINGNAGEEEYMVINAKGGTFTYVYARYIDVAMAEDIVLSILPEAEVITLLNDADDVHKMEFYHAAPAELKLKKWQKWMKRYEDWKEDDMDDYQEYMDASSEAALLDYSFEKK